MRENSLPKEKARNSPRLLKSDWDKIRLRYETGNYRTLTELSEEFGTCFQALESRMRREQWKEKKADLQRKVTERLEEKAIGKVEGYLSRLSLRAEKYEALLDQSAAQVGGPIEPSDLDAYTRSELRVVEMHKVALRIAPPSIDIKSGGLSIGESIVTAIEKLRANPTLIVPITSADVDRVLECEIVDDPPK